MSESTVRIVMKLSQYLKKNSGEEFVVLLHSLADADALGSAVGLCAALKKARIVASGGLSSSAKKMIQQTETKVSVTTIEKIKQARNTKKQKMILVDANSRAMLGESAGSVVFDCVVDHHSKHSDCVKAKNVFVDETASSTSEMVYEALKELNAEVNERTAVCLLAGIIADSAEFKNASGKTFSFVGELLAKTKKKYSQVREITESRPDVSQRVAVLKACQRLEFEKVGDFLIVSSSIGSFEAGAASALVEAGADVAFVGCAGEDGRISARVSEELHGKIDLAEIMKEIGAEFGGSGGGHAAAAGVNGLKREDVEIALERCMEKTKKKLGE